jgi:serine/threonine protein kinase
MDWKDMEDDSEDTPASFTRRYAAPEILEYRKNDSSSDIWSLGCVFIEMATVLRNHGADSIGHGMRTSWRGHPEALATALDAQGSGDLSPVVSWVKSMFSADPASRPTASVLFESIVETNEQGRVRFCGPCCIGDIDPIGLDYSAVVL